MLEINRCVITSSVVLFILYINWKFKVIKMLMSKKIKSKFYSRGILFFYELNKSLNTNNRNKHENTSGLSLATLESYV